MTTERIDIVVREDGSRVVKRNLDDIGHAADGAADALQTIKGLLTALVGAAALKTLADYTGIWTDLNARVQRFAGTAANTGAVMDRLMSIAQRTYAPLESTAEIYLENAFALEQLGKTQQQTLDYTEAMTNALVVSGAKGQRAETVIRALSKSMLDGKLKGEEWNTILQQGGRITELLTEQTGKSLVELNKMARDGKLTMDIVYDALVDNLEKLQEEADEMPATIGDAFIRMRNRIIQVVGELDQRLGASQMFVQFIDLINENLEKIIPTLAGVAVAVATAFAPGILQSFANQLRGLWLLMAAHPLVAVAAAIAGITTALYLMRDEINLGIDDTTTLGDMMRSVWESVGPMISAVAETAKNVFGFITEELGKSIQLWTGLNLQYQRENESLWLGVPRFILQVFDMVGAVIRGFFIGIWDMGKVYINRMKEQWATYGEMVSAALSGNFSRVKELMGDSMDAGAELGSAMGNAFSDAMQRSALDQSESGLEAWFNDRIKRAQEIGAERGTGESADLNRPSGFSPGAVIDEDALKKAAKELEKLKNSLRSLLDTIYPVDAAKRELKDAQELLTASVAKGLITQTEATQAYKDLEERMRDQLDPLGALNRELDKNIELLGMSAEQRQIEADLYMMTERLKRDGVKLTEDETAALRAKLVVEQELSKFSQARESAASNSAASALEDFEVTAKAMRSLLNDATSGYTSGDVALMITETLGQITNGTTIAAEAATAQWTMMYEQVQILRDQDVINEQQASELRRAIRQQELDMYVQRTSDALGMASGLMKANSKEAFKVGQAAAIGQAIVNTYTAATAAYQSAAAIPFVGWVLGPLAAAGAIAAGMAQVSAIRSQTMPAYRTGGTYTVGGMGGTDSQTVAFRASPGEQVSINTPSQANAMQNVESMLREDRRERGGRPINMPITVVQTGKPDNRTPEQNARQMRKGARKSLRASKVL